MTAASSPSPCPPHASHARTRVSCLSFVFLHSLSGAVTEGYEQDVGARTSFYGFTAFSLTQSLVILGRRGFRHVPLGKVSRGERARMREHPARKGAGRPGPGVCGGYGLRSHSGRERGGRPGPCGWAVWSGRRATAARGPAGSSPPPLGVLGPQDVRYLHFLEGARDYEWLEALLLNQTLVKKSLSWFR